MLEHQLKVGGIKNGDRAYLKLGGDGTNITKKDCCTVHTITLSSEDRALQISTVAVVMGGETYEVALTLIFEREAHLFAQIMTVFYF